MANMTGSGLEQCWLSMPIGLQRLLVGGIDYWQGDTVYCKVCEAWKSRQSNRGTSHDAGRGGRSVANRSSRECNGIQNRSVTEGTEK